jgi:hypothetical protein
MSQFSVQIFSRTYAAAVVIQEHYSFLNSGVLIGEVVNVANRRSGRALIRCAAVPTRRSAWIGFRLFGGLQQV